MSWLALVDGGRAIEAVFGAEAPALDGVSMHELALHRDGPSLTLRFDLARFPAAPPAKWRAQEANTAQVRLVLFGLGSVSIEGFTTTVIGDLALTARAAGGVELDFRAPGCRVKATATWARIGAVTAYQRADQRSEGGPR
jgi:hypothetical protein